MSSIVEIVIRTIDEASGANGGIIGSFTELQSTIMLGQEALSALKGIYDSTMGATLAYADSVRQLAAVSGTSTEEASKLLDVTGKLGVSSSTLEMGMKFLAKEGIQPTIESIAALSDQYLQLAPGVERDNFLVQNFGRSGLDMAVLMSQGSSAIMNLNDQVNRNLVLTQSQVEQAHKLGLEQAQLNDQWKAMTTQLSFQTMPAVTGLVTHFVDLNNQYQAAADLGYNYNMMSVQQRSEVQNLAAAYDNMGASMDYADRHANDLQNTQAQMTQTAKQQTSENKTQISDIEKLQTETDRYNGVIMNSIVQKQTITAEYQKGQISYKTEQTDLGNIDTALQKNSQQHQQWAQQMVFSMLQARVAAETALHPEQAGSLQNLLIQSGEKLGMFDAQTATVMQNVNNSFNTLDTSNADQAMQTIQNDLQWLKDNSYIPITVAVTQTGTIPNPGGGGGGSSGGGGGSGGTKPGPTPTSVSPAGGATVVINNSTVYLPSSMTAEDIQKAADYVGS